MIIGLLLLGSLFGLLAFGAGLVLGYSFAAAALLYVGTAALVVVGFSVTCAFRPRRRPPGPLPDRPQRAPS